MLLWYIDKPALFGRQLIFGPLQLCPVAAVCGPKLKSQTVERQRESKSNRSRCVMNCNKLAETMGSTRT